MFLIKINCTDFTPISSTELNAPLTYFGQASETNPFFRFGSVALDDDEAFILSETEDIKNLTTVPVVYPCEGDEYTPTDGTIFNCTVGKQAFRNNASSLCRYDLDKEAFVTAYNAPDVEHGVEGENQGFPVLFFHSQYGPNETSFRVELDSRFWHKGFPVSAAFTVCEEVAEEEVYNAIEDDLLGLLMAYPLVAGLVLCLSCIVIALCSTGVEKKGPNKDDDAEFTELDDKVKKSLTSQETAEEGDAANAARRPSDTRNGAAVTRSELVQVGYKNTIWTYILYAIICSGTLYYFGLFIVITLNQTATITLMNFETLFVITIVVWHLAAFWYFVVYIGAKGINVFRTRCHLANATHVELRLPISAMRGKTYRPAQPMMEGLADKAEYCLEELLRCAYCKCIDRGDPTRDECTRNFVVPVHTFTPEIGLTVKYIEYELRRFAYDESVGLFLPMKFPEWTMSMICNAKGLTTDQAHELSSRVGENYIKLEVPWLITAVFSEFSKPFYIYQWFIMQTWYWFDYWHMGLMTTVIAAGGGLVIAYTNRNHRAMLAMLARGDKSKKRVFYSGDEHSSGQQHQGEKEFVWVMRNSEWLTVDPINLYPGDMIKVPNGYAPCDFVLIRGACTVDEAMLTGESMPVQKGSSTASCETYNPEGSVHKKHTVYCGTIVLEVGQEVPIAMVTFTGGNTLKGIQIRSMLTPVNLPFKFYTETKMVMGILIVFACVGAIICVCLLGASPADAWYYAMYIVATAIPPLLPTVFVLSVEVSSNRLKAQKIICSNPERILMAGKVRVFCFDKTGTLTKQGLDFLGIREVVDGAFTSSLTNGSRGVSPKAIQSMACCCSLSLYNGEVLGNAVDVQMFKSTNWQMGTEAWNELSGPEGGNAHIITRFEFDPHLQLMSVIISDSTGIHDIIVKGSFEAVKLRCVSVPPGFDNIAEEYARTGSYVLAIARRAATVDEVAAVESKNVVDRDSLENGLELLGLLIYRNELKPDTADALRKLREGMCRSVIITGDNALTGRYIAGEAGMVPDGTTCYHASVKHDQVRWCDDSGDLVDLPVPLGPKDELFVDGKTFRKLDESDELEELLFHIRVYARMKPDDKKRAVEAYIDQNIITGMCGDGGNDCNALRTAHVGVALSDSDASVVAPFTDQNMSVQSVPALLLEGRAALCTSFACYKYMIMYGVLESVNQLANAYFAITFSEWTWIFLDGVFVVILSYCLGLSLPAEKLTPHRPTASLLGWTTMLSVMGPVIINIIFLCVALGILMKEDWMECRAFFIDPNHIRDWYALGDNYECAVIFLVSGSQYIHSTLQYGIGGEFRRNLCRNWLLVLCVIVAYAMFVIVIYYPSKMSCIFRVNCLDEYMIRGITQPLVAPVGNWEHSTIIPEVFQTKLIIIMVINGVIVVAWEYFFVQGTAVLGWARRRQNQGGARIQPIKKRKSVVFVA